MGEFRANMQKALSIVQSYPGVKDVDDWPIFHCTLNYFCCYSPDQKKIISQVVQNLPWQPFNLTFQGAVRSSLLLRSAR